MSIRIRAALTSVAALAAVTSVGLIAPANAAPKLPEGCTFNNATGTSTCTKNVQSTQTQQVGITPTLSDGSIAAEFCRGFFGPDYSYAYNNGFGINYGEPVSTRPATVTKTFTQVQTTTYQGVSAGQGNKPIATTFTTPDATATYSVTGNRLNCYGHDPDGYTVLGFSGLYPTGFRAGTTRIIYG